MDVLVDDYIYRKDGVELSRKDQME